MTLNRSAAALLAAVASSTGAGVATALATTGPDPYAVVNVRLTDGPLTLSKLRVDNVTYVDFLVRNVGKLHHDFRIGGLATRPVKSGQLVHLVVAFPEYGRYRYRCAIHCTPKASGWFQVDRPVAP